MTNVGFWFLFGAAFVSAAVISWIGFLELTYQLERRHSRKHAPATSLPEVRTAGTARDVLQPRKPAAGFREQICRACAEAAVKIAHASTQVTSLKSMSSQRGGTHRNTTAV